MTRGAQPHPSAAYPFEPSFVRVRGARMHYVDVGEGVPIVLLHGNPTWSYLWRNVIPHLAPKGRVIAPDLIGMGRSDKPAIDYSFFDHSAYLEGFLAELALERVVLVLHDWGSVLGFHYAARHEENVRGLAFMEANVRPRYSWDEFDPATALLFRRLRTPGVGWKLAVDDNVFVEELLPAAILRPLSPDEHAMYREPYREPAARKPLWRWANELPVAGDPPDVVAAVESYGAWLRRTTIPKLLLHATPGVVIGADLVRWCERVLPALESRHVGAGLHFIQEDEPDAIGSEIASWLDRRRLLA